MARLPETRFTDLESLRLKLGAMLGDEDLADSLLALVEAVSSDEGLALAFALKLAEQGASAVTQALSDKALASDLVFCLGASEPVAAGIAACGAKWLDWFRTARAASAESLDAAIRSFDDGAREPGDEIQALAEFKRARFLKIAVADLLGRTNVVETMRLMSALADEAIARALGLARKRLGARAHGAGDFCVIALGKLGACELNLSSDIDLMYLYDRPDALAGLEAATRVAETTTELLAHNCFRVDLRLRPGGASAPLVSSLAAALNFYENFGETWERAALLRARPVAGSKPLGRRFLEELNAFIYRRYLDFETLRQLRAMKERIEHEMRSPAMRERNIKLGRGGIREVEFIVQALMLIYGGRDSRLRTENTLLALERLESLGYLPPGHGMRLGESYRFLRDVEHKLQVAAGLQTHTLPEGADRLEELAARLRLGKGSQARMRMEELLRSHRDLVASEFQATLAASAELGPRTESAPAFEAWRAALDPERSIPALGMLGFAAPVESAAHLAALVQEPVSSSPSPRRRELLDALGPLLLDEISRLPDPDLALMNLTAFISAVGARTSFLALLAERPPTRRVLLRLFASSSYLSGLFIRHPELLDTLVRSDLARLRRPVAELRAELSSLIGAAGSFEARLDSLRSFRHQEFLRVAIADLAGQLDPDEVEVELTALAEAVLGEALAMAQAEVSERFTLPERLGLCVLAMGRLGAGEMSYNSDLDLIFIYDGYEEHGAELREIAARIAQKLIAILESRTREGYAYKLDLRLRPSGNQGMLVTSLGGFRDYHRDKSAVWERQSLLRARAVAGEPALAAAVEAERIDIVFGHGLDRAGVDEIAAMRQRIERELGNETATHLNLKQGRGGLLDVEFLTQAMAMRYGGAYPALRQRRTSDLLRVLGETGLIGPEQWRVLSAGYRFVSHLENRLRIESEQPIWALSTDRDRLLPVARRMGYEGEDAGERLLADLRSHREAIRAAFEQIFAREASR